MPPLVTLSLLRCQFVGLFVCLISRTIFFYVTAAAVQASSRNVLARREASSLRLLSSVLSLCVVRCEHVRFAS